MIGHIYLRIYYYLIIYLFIYSLFVLFGYLISLIQFAAVKFNERCELRPVYSDV